MSFPSKTAASPGVAGFTPLAGYAAATVPVLAVAAEADPVKAGRPESAARRPRYVLFHWMHQHLLRFSLRSLVIFATVAGIVCGFAGRCYIQHWRIEQIEYRGGFVGRSGHCLFNQNQPLRICLYAGHGGETPMVDECLQHALGLNQVESLQLWGAGIFERHLAAATHLPKLKELGLQDASVNDPALRQVAAMRSLERLWIRHCPVRGSGLKYLEHLNHLEEVSLAGSPVSDDDLAHLSRLSRVKTIDLSQTEVQGPGLQHLKNLPALETLTLSRLNLQGGSLEHLRDCPRLTDLDLSDSPITDDDLVHLADLRQLEVVRLAGTQITPRGLAKLRGLDGLQSVVIGGHARRLAWAHRAEAILPGVEIILE